MVDEGFHRSSHIQQFHHSILDFLDNSLVYSLRLWYMSQVPQNNGYKINKETIMRGMDQNKIGATDDVHLDIFGGVVG